MKLLLIGIGTLVALIFLVVIIGALLPKAHTASRSAVFKAIPEQLFALIDGPQTWRSNVKKYELVYPANGWRQWRETDNHGQTITYEAVERHPPTLLKTRIITANLPYSGTWTFHLEPMDRSTVLRITEEGEVYNPVFRFMSRFVIGQTSTIETYLRDLGTATGQQVEIRE
jgi:Polyketide cyclase / dehydrase and lipid transport